MTSDIPDEVAGSKREPGGIDGETMTLIGALLVLGSYLVFELLLAEYSQFSTSFLLAAVIVLVSRARGDWLETLSPRSTLVKALGYALAVSGAFEVLYDVRFQRLDDLVTILGALVAYVGFVFALLGARAVRP